MEGYSIKYFQEIFNVNVGSIRHHLDKRDNTVLYKIGVEKFYDEETFKYLMKVYRNDVEIIHVPVKNDVNWQIIPSIINFDYMASDAVVNNTKKRLKVVYSKLEMFRIKMIDYPIDENKCIYLDYKEFFNDLLDNYYSDYLMCLKSKESELFSTYLSLPKEKVKKNLLSELLSEWNFKL